MRLDVDLMEYANDAAAQAAYVSSDGSVNYGSDLLPTNASGMTADSNEAPIAYICDNAGTTFESASSDWPHWVKIDFGSGVTKQIRRTTINPQVPGGGARVKNFQIQGSNNDSDWTTVYTGQVANSSGVQTFSFSNTTSYRYYRLYVTSNWDAGTPNRIGIVEWELIEGIINTEVLSESTIKIEGSYSTKVKAKQTNSLNDTITRTVSPTVDLSNKDYIGIYMRASRTGANIKIGFHDSGGTTTEITPTINVADTWKLKILDLSAVANANKDVIDSIIITIVNADADNTFYIDCVYSDTFINNLKFYRRTRVPGDITGQ